MKEFPKTLRFFPVPMFFSELRIFSDLGRDLC